MAKKNEAGILLAKLQKNENENIANKFDILHMRLTAVNYFESDNIKIQLFLDTTNDGFKAICKKELDCIRVAEKNGNKTVHNPFETRDLMRFRIKEYSINDFKILFDDKFKDAKEQGFLTQQHFAKHELKNIDIYYKQCFDWFPVFEQWKEFLEEVAGSKEIKTKQQNKITLMDIAIFCRIIDDAKIERIGNKTQENYCKKICKDYYLNYTDRVRVNFTQNITPTNKQLSKVSLSILPMLTSDIKLKINNYINNKTKLYA